MIALVQPGALADDVFNASVLRSVVTVLPERGPDASRTVVRGEEVSGSGVVIRPGGYIATNDHVLAQAQAVFVRLADGRELPAAVVGRDEATDIALLKVEEDLPPLRIGKEPALGSPVCSVSDPFGVGLTVTCGVVSAVRRSGMGFNRIEDFIQTDAVLNPGSSGGALVDGEGALVGLVAAIFTRAADANIGINFAISGALLTRAVEDLLAQGKVVVPQIGARLQPLRREERRTLAGLRVAHVIMGSPAYEAGLRTGDVVAAIAGRAVRKASEVLAAVFLQRPGDRVEMTVVQNGEPKTLFLRLPR